VISFVSVVKESQVEDILFSKQTTETLSSCSEFKLIGTGSFEQISYNFQIIGSVLHGTRDFHIQRTRGLIVLSADIIQTNHQCVENEKDKKHFPFV